MKLMSLEPQLRSAFSITVEPVYNGHPRDLGNWSLNTGSLKYSLGMVSVMSILIEYLQKHFMQGNNRIINTRWTGRETWNQVSMIAPVKKFARAKLSTDFVGKKHGGRPSVESVCNVL